MQNIIFLDIDGVLNSKFWDSEHQREMSDGKFVDEEAVRLLAELVNRADARVILHSGWRFWFDEDLKPLRPEAEHLLETMQSEDITIDGVTPDLTTEEIRRSKKFSLVKADEILLWMKENGEFANWVVLDDLDLHNSEVEKHQIKPDPNVGITKEDVDKALIILSA